MHHFCLLYADRRAKIGTELCKFVNFLLCCMSSSETEFKELSSANMKSLIVSVLTLVFAWSLLRLKTEPSIRCVMPMPISVCERVCQHGREYQAKQRWGQDTSLFYSI